ncbi:MAG: hypothetical protein IJU70_10965 [Lentisphaeria bacterium]|nr:hypothetical protein [Lentisphaeria bacterium]
MRPVFGLSVPDAGTLSLLPDELPAAVAFGEITGEMLENTSLQAVLRRIFLKHDRALVVRDIVPPKLADAVPASPLRLKMEFDSGFRARCRAASALGCRVVSAEFAVGRALNDAAYEAELVKVLHSAAGTLEEFGLVMAFPLRLPAEAERAAAFLAFKHRLFYPGFRYLLDFHFEEPEAFAALERALPVLTFDRSLWRLPHLPGAESPLTAEVLEKMRPVWCGGNDGRSVFVCVDAGSGPEGEFPFARLAEMFTCFLRKGTL